jgi:autophagy-related protein 16
MAEPAWQELLRLRLAERNSKESAFAPVIEQCMCTHVFLYSPLLFRLHSSIALPIPQDRRLAQQTKLLKERNASLLRAVATVKQNPSSSTVFVPGTSEECVLTTTMFSTVTMLRYIPAGTLSVRPISLLSSRKSLRCAMNWLRCTRLRVRMHSAF